MHGPIALLMSDLAVLSSLRFALSVEGFQLAAAEDCLAAAVLVIDQAYQEDGVAALLALRAKACRAPAVILATNPTASYRARAGAANAVVVEKPLFGDELSGAISNALQRPKALARNAA